jgi:protein gp37
VPAAVRFLSVEPMLGPVNLGRWLGNARWVGNGQVPYAAPTCRCGADYHETETQAGCSRYRPDYGIHWVIVGGESGPKARPMHPGWARSVRDQCQASGVPYFFNQWGEYVPTGQGDVRASRWELYWDGLAGDWTSQQLHREDGPEMNRVGKKAAGRLLDGRTWDEFPAPATTPVETTP